METPEKRNGRGSSCWTTPTVVSSNQIEIALELTSCVLALDPLADIGFQSTEDLLMTLNRR